MAERLYWKHPELNTFTARMIHTGPCVEKVDTCNSGETLVKVWLDQTLFYPEGGGQPYDAGFLKANGLGATLPVTKVMEEDGDIAHYVCCPPAELNNLLTLNGNEVCGKIDWQRRFDHMQQHTGQHILSQACLRVLEASTTGFHMSREYASIDLAIAEINQDQVQEVEQVANEVVFGNVPVKAAEYAPCDLPPMVRRRLPKETDIVRVIEIGDFDSCACGGTHVTSTGQVGLIKISEVGRAHGGVRVTFRCGGRALADYQEQNESAWACARLLSVPVNNTLSGVQSLLAKMEEQEQ
ncbi:MAG TPA: alanyl-tRNA editing protein, partial [Clostridiaceae bacterium]|nr:alanyl-tRNA editing protein [Clostridiaceae bacterium]